MAGEFLVVSGARLGDRFSLSAGEVRIGKDPRATIRLGESGVAWEHCVVSLCGERYRLVDRRSGTGTYVNGHRTSEHWLEAGDQVVIGETVFVYREDSAVPGGSPHTLLQACWLLFLFRALAEAESESVRAMLETQLVRLIGDLAPLNSGAVLLGRDWKELQAAAATPALAALAGRGL